MVLAAEVNKWVRLDSIVAVLFRPCRHTTLCHVVDIV